MEGLARADAGGGRNDGIFSEGVLRMRTCKKACRKMPAGSFLLEMLKAVDGNRLPELRDLEYVYDESLIQLFHEVELDVVADALLYSLATLDRRERAGAVAIFFKSWEDEVFKEPICNFCANIFTGDVEACNPNWVGATKEYARRYAEKALTKCEEVKRENEENDCYDPVCAIIPDNTGTAAIALETEYGYCAIGVSVCYHYNKEYQGDTYVMMAVIAQCLAELQDGPLRKSCGDMKKILSGLLPATDQMMDAVAKMFDEENDSILDKWKKWLYDVSN